MQATFFRPLPFRGHLFKTRQNTPEGFMRSMGLGRRLGLDGSKSSKHNNYQTEDEEQCLTGKLLKQQSRSCFSPVIHNVTFVTLEKGAHLGRKWADARPPLFRPSYLLGQSTPHLGVRLKNYIGKFSSQIIPIASNPGKMSSVHQFNEFESLGAFAFLIALYSNR